MLFTLTNRESLVQFLPNGGTGAEIGVARGDFAKVLLDHAAPRELHLIDPWSHLESDDLAGGAILARVARDPGAHLVPPAENRLGDEQFRGVVERFSSDLRVRLHRQFSYKIAPVFPDSFFDFIYIDGNHTYEFVLRDLLDFAPKVKADGLIMGHDFFHNDFAERENYGVMPAVQTFLRRRGYQFVALTCELFSSYVIAKDLRGFAAGFVDNLLHSNVGLIRLPSELAFFYRDELRTLRDGRDRRIPAFTSLT
jgi:hypothetical protein